MTVLLPDAIAELEAIDPNALCDMDLHGLALQLVSLDSRFAAVRARVLAVWDGRQLWASDNSKAGWGRLARECSLNPKTAKREMVRARKLAAMPATSTAVAEGWLSMDQAELLRWANQPSIAKVFARDEAFLISTIRRLRHSQARKALDYWIDHAYQELGLDRPYRNRDGRRFHGVRTLDGTVDLQGLMDALAGTEVLTELHRIEQQFFADDWAAARAEYGPNALPSQLPRTFAQRNADALQQMARNSAAYREGQHRQPRPLITILCGDKTFETVCELSDGTVISPGQVVPYLCEGDIERIVFDGPSRVIDVGVRERFFTGALRRAIEVRDRHCQHPSGCDVPAEDCQVDHTVRYTDGGETTQENGKLHCSGHNLAKENHPEREQPFDTDYDNHYYDNDEPEERPPPPPE